jgi:hypothetical protein
LKGRGFEVRKCEEKDDKKGAKESYLMKISD